jgi:hypothetical protein
MRHVSICRRVQALTCGAALSSAIKDGGQTTQLVGIAAARPRNLTANGTSNDQLDTFQSVTRPGHSPAQLARTRGDRGRARLCSLYNRSIMDGKFRPGPTYSVRLSLTYGAKRNLTDRHQL